MIDATDSNEPYYYHYDGLGSVVALSDSAGDTVQIYGYSVYGEVVASDPDFTANPYMFTGRRFDIETGLYYYRARYYNPHIGRFMQTDSVGYGDGMNMYAYCGNNPVGRVDPSGNFSLDIEFSIGIGFIVTTTGIDCETGETQTNVNEYPTIGEFLCNVGRLPWCYVEDYEAWKRGHDAWLLADGDEGRFWSLKLLEILGVFSDSDYGTLVDHGVAIGDGGPGAFSYGYNTIYWDKSNSTLDAFIEDESHNIYRAVWAGYCPPLAVLAHELDHALYFWNICGGDQRLFLNERVEINTERRAAIKENEVRYIFYAMDWGKTPVYPRPGYGTAGGKWFGFNGKVGRNNVIPAYENMTADEAWNDYFRTWW